MACSLMSPDRYLSSANKLHRDVVPSSAATDLAPK